MFTREKLSTFLSYLTFEAYGLRLGLELSLCFIIFEIVAYLTSATQADGVLLLCIWLASCTAIGLFDLFVFLPPLRYLEEAFRLSFTNQTDLAIQIFSELDPEKGRIIHFPKPGYHLQRARFFADAGRTIEASLELSKAREYGCPEEKCKKLELDMLRSEGAYEVAFQRLASNSEQTPEVMLEMAVLKFEQGYSYSGYGVERDSLRESLKLFEDIAEKAVHLQDLTSCYAESCKLWLGKAEDAFPKLIKQLGSLPFSINRTSSFNRHLGRLYLARAYYALTHGEEILGASDNRLGGTLLPPSQLKQLRVKIGEELGGSCAETYSIDIINNLSPERSG